MKRLLKILTVLCALGAGAAHAQSAITISSVGTAVAASLAGVPLAVTGNGLNGRVLAIMGWDDSYNTIPSYGNDSVIYALNYSKLQDVRQAGTIYKVGMFTGAIPGSLAQFGVIVWRYNGTDYDEVGRSENLAGKVESSVYNEVVLSSPIDSVLPGDKVGFYFSAPANTTNWLTRVSGFGNMVRANAGVTPGSTFNWDNTSITTTVTGQIVPIAIYMDPPWAVSLSNSIFTGWNANYSARDLTTGTDRANCLPCLLSDSMGLNVANHGIGGEMTYSLLARVQRDVIDYHPKVVFIEGGHNDFAGFDIHGLHTGTEYYASEPVRNIDSIVARCDRAGIICVWTEIHPSTGFPTRHARGADSANALINAFVEAHNGYVISSSTFGEFRSGGDVGNLWDPKSALFSDGIHFTHAGALQQVNLILPVARAIYAITGP